jgi:CRP-like cAMP-binding protein
MPVAASRSLQEGMMPVSSLREFVLSKLRAHLPDEALWSDVETSAFRHLGSTARTVRRGTDIIVQGRTYDSVFVLAEGFALRYRILVDGRRQALNVSIPGDTIGCPECFFETALYSVGVLSNAVIYAINFAEITAIFRDHPRLALAMFWSMARETAMFGEHLADVGWRNACERLAHFLLEMATRLSAIGLSDGSTFDLPLTQARLADVLGLSIPHVNRMLRRLREDGLIEMVGPRVRILDRTALAALADFNDTYLTRGIPKRAATHLKECVTAIHNGRAVPINTLNPAHPVA